MDNNKEFKIEITELFLAKCGNDFSRCFHGTLTRTIDENGYEILHGKILVKNDRHDSIIYAKASDRDILGKMLDEMVIMILDGGLHSDSGKTSDIAGTLFFHN